MSYKFVIHVYDINGGNHVIDHELENITVEEVLNQMDFPERQVLGGETIVPIKVMKYWSQRFGFEYHPDLYDYTLSTYTDYD